MPIYAAGPRPATMTLAPTSRRCIKHTLDRYLPLRSSTTKQRNSADPTPQIIARIASRPVSPDSSRAQISIAPARHRPTFPDRGFLPWRLSDAGRRCTWHRRVRPASETLHKSRHFSQKHYKLVAAISCLYRGARCGPERAEHATITRFGFQPLATALAVVKVLASIRRHMFCRLVSALRAGDC